MRRSTALFSALVIAALVAAPMSAAFAAGTTDSKKQDLNVTVVSVNSEAKTMTVKTPTGEEKTAKVIGEAINKLKTVKAGDSVTVTCTADNNGELKEISDIKKAS